MNHQLLASLLVIFTVSGCSLSKKVHSKTMVGSSDGTEAESSGGAGEPWVPVPTVPDIRTVIPELPSLGERARLNSIQFYDETVYQPIISANCNSCHHQEKGHHGNAASSHDYALANHRVNLGFPDLSLLVNKIKGGHNCWSGDCLADAKALEDGISNWASKLPQDAVNSVPYRFKTNNEVPLAEGALVNPAYSSYLGGPITASSTAGTWATLSDIPRGDGNITQFVQLAPTEEAKVYGDPTAGTATYNLDIEAAGLYFLWARVKIESDSGNEFFVQAGDQVETFAGAPTDGNWAWQRLGEGFDLQAGSQTITISEKEGGLSLSYIVLTPWISPNLDFLNQDIYESSVDITSLVNHPSSLVVRYYWEGKGIVVQQIRLNTSKGVSINSIFPLGRDDQLMDRSLLFSRVYEKSDIIWDNTQSPLTWDFGQSGEDEVEALEALNFGFTDIR